MTSNTQAAIAQHETPKRSLYVHTPHLHIPHNVNELHAAEKRAEGVNTGIAITLTRTVGSMWTAYAFVVLAIIGLLGILGLLPEQVALLVAWTSQTLIQLVLLPVIMVGQNVLGRKAELQADEAFNTTMSTYHDIEQIMEHLSAQDDELLRHAKMLIQLLEKSGITMKELEAEGAGTSHLQGAFAQPPAADGAPAPTPANTDSAPAEENK
jgi:hypothetical protein